MNHAKRLKWLTKASTVNRRMREAESEINRFVSLWRRATGKPFRPYRQGEYTVTPSVAFWYFPSRDQSAHDVSVAVTYMMRKHVKGGA